MPRSDDDSWDLASSVGATATMVAAGRAIATKDPRGLIDDPFAAPLVRAVGIDFFTKMVDGEVDIAAIDPESAPCVQANIDEVAVRTRYFDDYCTRATAAGIRQVVILASGLDSRAYRLPWPDATTVFRDRSARCDRVQDVHACRDRRRTDRAAPHRVDRPA